MASVLYFFAPIQTTCVLSKFVFKSDIFAKFSSSCNVSSRLVFDPSKKAEASSAYCENLNSMLPLRKVTCGIIDSSYQQIKYYRYSNWLIIP